MKFYLAGSSRPESRALIAEAVKQIENAGHECTCKWFCPERFYQSELAAALADDLQGIRDAEAVIGVVDSHARGTLWELGYAQALNKPLMVYLVAPRLDDSELCEFATSGLWDRFKRVAVEALEADWLAVQAIDFLGAAE